MISNRVAVKSALPWPEGISQYLIIFENQQHFQGIGPLHVNSWRTGNCSEFMRRVMEVWRNWPTDRATGLESCCLLLHIQNSVQWCWCFTWCSCSCILDCSGVSWLQPTSSCEIWALSPGQSASLRWSSWVASLDTDAFCTDVACTSMEKSCSTESRSEVRTQLSTDQWICYVTWWMTFNFSINVCLMLRLWLCHVCDVIISLRLCKCQLVCFSCHN